MNQPELTLLLSCVSRESESNIRELLGRIPHRDRRQVLSRTIQLLLRSEMVHEREFRVGAVKVLRALSHRESRIIAKLHSYRKKNIQQLRRLFKKESSYSRKLLARQVSHMLRTSEWAADEDLRISGVEWLTALLPEAMPYISKVLSDQSRPLSYEVHFSLFVFADQEEIPDDHRQNFLLLVEKYIRNLRKDVGEIAWKVGEYLGSHWNDMESVEILLRCAQSAKYSAGRRAAVIGLLDVYPRVDASDKKEIKSIVRKVHRRERNGKVKDTAAYVLRCLKSK